MEKFLADIPPNERLPFILIFCAILFVFGGLMYFRIRYNVWFAKRMIQHGQEALSYGRSEDAHNKNVWKTKKTWSKAAAIYSLAGIGLLALWFIVESVIPVLFGLSFLIGGIICASHASMTETQLQTYLAHKKNQSILITRIFILGSIAAYILWFLLPRSFFSSIDILTIFAFISPPIAIAGALDHFYTRARLSVA